MKHVLIMAVAACCLVACATTNDKADRADRHRRVAAMVADSVERRTLTIEVDYATPTRFAPRHLTSRYTVRIDGDTIVSALPFFGRAYRANLSNPQRGPLDFAAPIEAYECDRPRKDRQDLRLKTRNGMEVLTYRISIFDNGRASVDVVSTDRDAIGFTGQMTINDEQP